MVLYVFFNLFKYTIQSRFKEKVASFYECPFSFLFLCNKELSVE